MSFLAAHTRHHGPTEHIDWSYTFRRWWAHFFCKPDYALIAQLERAGVKEGWLLSRGEEEEKPKVALMPGPEFYPGPESYSSLRGNLDYASASIGWKTFYSNELIMNMLPSDLAALKQQGPLVPDYRRNGYFHFVDHPQLNGTRGLSPFIHSGMAFGYTRPILLPPDSTSAKKIDPKERAKRRSSISVGLR